MSIPILAISLQKQNSTIQRCSGVYEHTLNVAEISNTLGKGFPDSNTSIVPSRCGPFDKKQCPNIERFSETELGDLGHVSEQFGASRLEHRSRERAGPGCEGVSRSAHLSASQPTHGHVIYQRQSVFL